MPQGILPYKYEEEKKPAGMTALAGLPLYLDLASALGLPKSIDRHLHLRPTQGWTDPQMVLSLMSLPLRAGTVSMISRFWRRTRASAGFWNILSRKASSSRWRTEKPRAVPSPSSVFRYLSAFHSDE